MSERKTEWEKYDILITAMNRIYNLEVAHSRDYQMIAAHALDLVEPRKNENKTI